MDNVQNCDSCTVILVLIIGCLSTVPSKLGTEFAGLLGSAVRILSSPVLNCRQTVSVGH
jgi:hypothetical protein